VADITCTRFSDAEWSAFRCVRLPFQNVTEPSNTDLSVASVKISEKMESSAECN
jgi:hypothetical protein